MHLLLEVKLVKGISEKQEQHLYFKSVAILHGHASKPNFENIKHLEISQKVIQIHGMILNKYEFQKHSQSLVCFLMVKL